MKTVVFSKDLFTSTMQTRGISDDTVESTDEFFICIDSTGGPFCEPYFKTFHANVIRLVFDDTDTDKTQWGAEINDYYNAKAMIIDQARVLVAFIKKIPDGAYVNIHCTKGKSRSVAVASFINNLNEGNLHVLTLLRQAWTGR